MDTVSRVAVSSPVCHRRRSPPTPYQWKHRVQAVVMAALLLIPGYAPAQQTPGEPPTKAESETEAGGRLVITGDTIVVVGDPDAPVDRASIATKTDTPLLETPRSVSVTDRHLLDERQAVNIANAHDYTVSLMPADERGPAFSRGFSVSFYDLRRDGLRTYAWSVREPVAIERVQYLRGPASILYGDGSPGGLVNMVLRKPLPIRRGELTVSGGSLGFGRVTGDLTGPAGSSGRTRYRVIGAAEWLDNGFDNDERRLTLLPMASFDLGRSATLHVDTELYQQRGRNYWHTVPATADTQHGDFSRIPWTLNTASPDDGWSGWNVSPGARLDWTVRPGTSLHSAIRYTRIGGDIDGYGLVGVAADGRTLNRYDYLEQSVWQEWQSDTFVATPFTTGRVSHLIVTGVEAGLSTTDSEIGVGAGTPIDLFEPVYPAAGPPPPLQPTRFDTTRVGLYAQDQMRLHPAVTLVPAVRWNRIGVDDHVMRTTPVEQRFAGTRVSPSLGLVVLPRSWLSFFGAASQGFEPPAPGRFTADGRALSAAESTMVEGGMKVDTVGGGLVGTASVYRIERTNVAEADGTGFYRQIGEGRSRGVELELVGRVGRGLLVQSAYAFTDTAVTRSLLGTEGNRLPNAPRHNASLWTHYRMPGGALAGTTIGAGVVHVSDRYLASDNVVIAPAYTRIDLAASYELRQRRLRISLAVPNLMNVRYVTSGAGRALYAGAPRRVSLQLSSFF